MLRAYEEYLDQLENELNPIIDRETLSERDRNIYDLLGHEDFVKELKKWKLEKARKKKQKDIDRLVDIWMDQVEQEYMNSLKS